jgi:hypothetical protein
VTTNLYRSLQLAQGKDSTTTASDTTLSTTVTGVVVQVNDNEANMPSLGKDVIGSLFSGLVSDWSVLKTPAGGALSGLPGDTAVYVARRVATSGTQKGSELFLFGGTPKEGIVTGACAFLPASCNTAALGMVTSPNHNLNPNGDPETNCSAQGGITVFEGSGSGNVRNCLALHNTGARWAIGILSTESPYAATNGWRFVKIDGQSPSLLNVFYNRYKNWVEQTIQKPQYAITSDAGNTVTAIATTLGNENTINAVNQGLRQPWGAGALFVLGANGLFAPPAAPANIAAIQDHPTLPWTKSPLGSTDNCKQPSLGTDPSFTPFTMPLPFPTAP